MEKHPVKSQKTAKIPIIGKKTQWSERPKTITN